MTVIELLLKGQYVLFGVMAALIIGGVIRDNNYSVAFCQWLGIAPTNRIAVFFLSFIGGILPVEGRSAISAPILDSTCCKHLHPDKRKPLGMVDYFSTHHYYLWSPLEPSVLIIMAGLGLTYTQFLSYTIAPLLVYAAFLAYVIYKHVHPTTISSTVLEQSSNVNKALVNIALLVFSIGLLVGSSFAVEDAGDARFQYWNVLPFTAIALMLIAKTNLWTAIRYVKPQVVLWVMAVVAIGNVIKSHNSEMLALLESSHLPVIALTALGTMFAFMMGSSSKYAGITVLICKVTSPVYLPIVLVCEYIGYLNSPTHKCLAIANQYFGTDIKQMYLKLGILSTCLLAAGIINYLVTI